MAKNRHMYEVGPDLAKCAAIAFCAFASAVGLMAFVGLLIVFRPGLSTF